MMGSRAKTGTQTVYEQDEFGHEQWDDQEQYHEREIPRRGGRRFTRMGAEDEGFFANLSLKKVTKSVAPWYDLAVGLAVVATVGATIWTANPVILTYMSIGLVADVFINKALKYDVNGALRGRTAANTFHFLAATTALSMLQYGLSTSIGIGLGLILTGKLVETLFTDNGKDETPGLILCGTGGVRW